MTDRQRISDDEGRAFKRGGIVFAAVLAIGFLAGLIAPDSVTPRGAVSAAILFGVGAGLLHSSELRAIRRRNREGV